MTDPYSNARILVEALPWIKHSYGKTVLIKYGGAAMSDPALRHRVAEDIILMKLVGVNPVVVHGGGPEISSLMRQLDMPVTFLDGQRVTDAAAMDVVKMALVGKVNKEIVGAINAHGHYAVGVSGEDGGLVTATQHDERLGRVGDVTEVDATLVNNLIEDGFIPVIASVAAGDDGGSFNVNADIVAGELASALGADKVVFLTDVDGLYRDFSDKDSLISELSSSEAEELVVRDALEGGMIPKVGACLRALRGGVSRATILNGTVPHAILLELFTQEGIGTMIASDGEGEE